MTQAIATRGEQALIRKITLSGDLSGFTEAERYAYALALCDRYKLDPLTKPFDFISSKTGVKIYANESCTDQLRKNHSCSAEIIKTEIIDDCFLVWARIITPDDRYTDELGSTSLKGSAEDRANAMKKAVTQALRRGTLAHCGLTALDESEVPDVKGAQKIETKQAFLCTPATMQRLRNAFDILGEAKAKAEFLRLFPSGRTLADLGEINAVRLAEAYESIISEMV